MRADRGRGRSAGDTSRFPGRTVSDQTPSRSWRSPGRRQPQETQLVATLTCLYVSKFSEVAGACRPGDQSCRSWPIVRRSLFRFAPDALLHSLRVTDPAQCAPSCIHTFTPGTRVDVRMDVFIAVKAEVPVAVAALGYLVVLRLDLCLTPEARHVFPVKPTFCVHF